MKALRLLTLITCLFGSYNLAFAQSKKSAPVTPVDPRELAVKKMNILDQQLHFSTDQQNQVISILEKYDDENTANGTTPYTITEKAEREMMEIMSENQLAYYKSNLTQVRNSLKMGGTPAAPAEKKSTPSSTKKKSSTSAKTGR